MSRGQTRLVAVRERLDARRGAVKAPVKNVWRAVKVPRRSKLGRIDQIVRKEIYEAAVGRNAT